MELPVCFVLYQERLDSLLLSHEEEMLHYRATEACQLYLVLIIALLCNSMPASPQPPEEEQGQGDNVD